MSKAEVRAGRGAIALGILLTFALVTSCKKAPCASGDLSCSSSQTTAQGGQCAISDVNCFLSRLTVQENGASVPLQTIDTSRLSPSGVPAALPFIWAVGRASWIAGWNGSGWTTYSSSVSQLNAVWTFATNNAWAAGVSDTLLHWDGTTWSAVALPGSTGMDDLVGLWGDTSDDLWVITQDGKAAHYTGTWSSLVSITSSATAIWGFSASDVWAVGGTGTAVHYNGTSWTPFNTGATYGLVTVWGNASNDVWAAGGGPVSVGDLIFHWDGLAWSADAAASQVVMSIGAPASFAGTSSHDVWQAGYNYQSDVLSNTVLAHDDGTGWKIQSTVAEMNPGGSLWAAAPNDVWMVATDFHHWDGTSWTVVPGPAGPYSAVRGVTPGGGGNKTPPSITNMPPPMTFPDTAAKVSVTLDWNDPSGCRPALCFSLCNPALQCSTSARCSSAVHDGLLLGQTILTLGYTAGPADGTADLTLQIRPVSSPSCQDPIALLAAGSSGALVGVPVTVDQIIVAATPTGGADGGTDGGSGSTCAGGGLLISTLDCDPIGNSGTSSYCLSAAEFMSATGLPLPAACAPAGTTGCEGQTGRGVGILAKPCCPGLTCRVTAACGDPTGAVGGSCQP